jgi:hypothetical protein
MKPTFGRLLLFAGALWAVAILVACGGSSSSGAPPPPPPPPSLTITDNSILPGTLQSHAYTATLHVTHAVGAVTWSIGPISSTALFVDGLTIDPSTGVLSGNANFAGTGGFVASVTDSSSPPRTARKSFTITAYGPLQAPAPQSFTVGQYQQASTLPINPQGGVQPLSFTVTGGSLPPGLRLDGQLGFLLGSATAIGTRVSTVTIQDSFTPPEAVTVQMTVVVFPPQLQLPGALPIQILRNRPFSGRAVAIGGIPPYKFTLTAGTLPPGFSPIELNTGGLSGTPTTLGSYFYSINVSDSSSPPQTIGNNFSTTVVDPIGRNDTIATATPIVQDGFYTATISPYIDPPDNAPLAADNDYYKLVAISGSTVHLETMAQRGRLDDPLDTVIEVVDGNGSRQTACRLPGSVATTFNSSCINDDIGGSPYLLDSALDFKVPGAQHRHHVLRARARLAWRRAARYGVHASDFRRSLTPHHPHDLARSGRKNCGVLPESELAEWDGNH